MPARLLGWSDQRTGTGARWPQPARWLIGLLKIGGAGIAGILDIVRGAPKPLLIHCKSGADRTGLVAALYRYAEGGASAAEADRELSLAYGHFPYLTSRSGAMDDSFWAYVRANPGGGGR